MQGGSIAEYQPVQSTDYEDNQLINQCNPQIKVKVKKKNDKFNASPIKCPTAFSQNRKTILKFMWNKRSRRAKATLRKNKAAVIRLPHCKTYYRATVSKLVWCWQRDRCTDQRNRTQPAIVRRAPRIPHGERTALSTHGAGKTAYLHAKGWNWTPILHHTQI